jgi:hypothetical protein
MASSVIQKTMVYKDFDSQAISFNATVAGVFAGQENINIALSGYKPVGVSMIRNNHSAAHNLQFIISDSTLTVLYYSAYNSAFTFPAGDKAFRVLYTRAA